MVRKPKVRIVNGMWRVKDSRYSVTGPVLASALRTWMRYRCKI